MFKLNDPVLTRFYIVEQDIRLRINVMILNVNTLYFLMSAVSSNNFPTVCYIITFFVKKQEIRFIDSLAGFSRSSGKCTAKSVLSLCGTL